nr:RNA-directed DNA polymerase, eukaryota, reverse transcriptase zinc-binding domain protein [Tanacetum cinerariifolium]
RYGSIDGILGETVPVANSYQALDDQVMEDKEKAIEAAMDNEYENVIWPKLKEDVVSIINSGVYPWIRGWDGMADEMRPETTDGLLKKLDRVLSNFGFVEKFSNANAQFLPFVVSDHSPSVLVIPSRVSAKPKPFKFANYLDNKAEFLRIVEMVRNLHVSSLLVCYLVICARQWHVHELEVARSGGRSGSYAFPSNETTVKAPVLGQPPFEYTSFI